MSLKKIHKNFIKEAFENKTSIIKVVEPKQPVIPVNRWISINQNEKLKKNYKFLNSSDRNLFIEAIFEYEIKTKHYASINIFSETEVCIEITTKDINQITNIDKEYAKYCDKIYKDICYEPNSLLRLMNDS